MYTTYFGLKEKPFSIAPNPQYLFMSDRHREALAHLTYGLGDAGGFVLLTGEVGTGKTTVSRCLMERLPENTQAAFILNPTLSSQELLATICDELKIRYRKTGATLKTLTDKIQDKLLKNHKANTNTLLIIDEAQHLKPEVLEQLRLLTNLETNTKKLLQVILIGQPELQTLLKRRDLRQLAQRITARYHLLPLNKQEVAQYIKHRLSIAEGIRALFSASAMNAIYDICGGIPRLINLVCERSLINAYNGNVAVVDKKIVLLSAKEALGEDHQITPWWQYRAIKIVFIVFVLLGLSAGAYFSGSYFSDNKKDVSLIEKPEVTNVDTIAGALNTSKIASNDLSASTGKTMGDNSKVSSNQTVEPKVTPKPIKEPATSTDIKSISSKSVSSKKVTSSEIVDEVASASVTEKTQVENSKDKKIKAESIKDKNKALELTQVEGVSDELLEQFKKALANDDTENDRYSEYANDDAENRSRQIDSIDKMPLWVQNGIPSLQFEQHIYASDGKGWVKVNGRDRYEGDTISRQLTLVEILPQKVVLNFRGEKFTMRALSSW
ncbi:AAA family ATPase [Pseudocolwellia sp. HL-MZ7]|uniref:AAA family ATPase n=1 Tax=Pseudocolwellia sp. HL-MZ7 TaxID=3400627 RepID=UPI003CF0655C